MPFKSKPPPPKLWPKELYWFLNTIFTNFVQKFESTPTLRNFEPTIALTEAERDAQDSLKMQQKELQENITVLFDALYLADHDAYTAKLATKNTAIVHFRAKQTELRHLHANESILAAFQNAGTQIFLSSRKLSPSTTASP